MKGSGIESIKNKSWSKLDKDYGDVEEKLVANHNFFWELENWEVFAKNEKKKPDKGTYARYIKDKDYGSY